MNQLFSPLALMRKLGIQSNGNVMCKVEHLSCLPFSLLNLVQNIKQIIPKAKHLPFLAALLLSGYSSQLCYAANTKTSADDKAEQVYQRALTQGFDKLATQFQDSSFKKANIDALYKDVQKAMDGDKHASALLLLYTNKHLLKQHINHEKVAELFAYALGREALPLVEKLNEWAVVDGDVYTVSLFNYHFAQYYYRLGDWIKARDFLSAIEVRNALSTDQGDYATIIFGVTLQNNKQHRAAIKYYDEISENSKYYGYAQLNKAVAFVRQGWWTDAKIAIDSALEKSNDNEEFINRLHLVLGYSQLQHEFYRNARESFRHIAVDSRYADRALLGIGLCALNQGDYVGAINAFGILKDKPRTNISISESFLLYAFTHEQMKQSAIASAHYDQAIAYYGKRIRQVDQLLAGLKKLDDNSAITQHFSQSNSHIIPSHLAIRLENIEYLSASIMDKKLKKELDSAKRFIDTQLTKLYRAALIDEKGVLVSYLSQAQFGQAKLFDDIQ